jgi:hypothetical protein
LARDFEPADISSLAVVPGNQICQILGNLIPDSLIFCSFLRCEVSLSDYAFHVRRFSGLGTS